MNDIIRKLITLLLIFTISAAFTPLFGYVYAEESEEPVISEQTEDSNAEDFQSSDQDETPDAETDKAVEESEAQSFEAEQLPDNVEDADGEDLTDIVEPQNEKIVLEDSGDEPEELYDGYLKMKAYGSGIRKTAGNRLKGANKGAYDYLNAEIAKVAAGKRSSTIFEMSAEDVFGNKNYWTAADLGLASLTDYNGNIETAEKKCQDFKAVINALLADNPYSLYWYDKTYGTECRGFTLRLDITEERIYAEGKMCYKLPVAAAYSEIKTETGTKLEGTYEFDTEIGQSSIEIVETACNIVSKYDGLGDRERLSKYGDEICRMVDYNRTLSKNEPYGDPWQLIWVFDGDPLTNVVCEGYSKAFKFLCDLTDFTGNVNCIVATGMLTTPLMNGGHMWNVVSLDNGYNYLVDVTHSDSGTSLAEEGLFMCKSPYSGIYPDYCFRRLGKAYTYNYTYTYDDDCLSTYDKSELLIPGKVREDTSDKEGEEDIRIYGDTRYDTAVNAAEMYESASGSKFDNVIVAYGKNFPDALSGGYLAKVKNAPILLVEPNEEDRIVDYISENILPIGTVYILGGTGVVSSEFESKVRAKGISTTRLGGKTRYDTNLAILRAAGAKAEDILVCTGNGYADSLSASAAGKPILLVGNSLTDAQKKYIKGLRSKQFYLIGGTGAVRPAVEKGLKDLGLTTVRLAGQTRYETSAAVAKKFFKKTETVVLAYALNFPDGLSGGPLAMQESAPIILTDSVNTETAKNYIKGAGAIRSITLGGPALISDEAVEAIMGR